MKKPANLRLKTEEVKDKRTHEISQDFKSRREQYNKLKELRQIIKNKKAKSNEKIKAERERLEAKKRRKEINMLKSGGYEIIKNPLKIKKWKRKARQLLQKLPPELFYEKANN